MHSHTLSRSEIAQALNPDRSCGGVSLRAGFVFLAVAFFLTLWLSMILSTVRAVAVSPRTVRVEFPLPKPPALVCDDVAAFSEGVK